MSAKKSTKTKNEIGIDFTSPNGARNKKKNTFFSAWYADVQRGLNTEKW